MNQERSDKIDRIRELQEEWLSNPTYEVYLTEEAGDYTVELFLWQKAMEKEGYGRVRAAAGEIAAFTLQKANRASLLAVAGLDASLNYRPNSEGPALEPSLDSTELEA